MSITQEVTGSSLEQNIINTAIEECIMHLRTCVNRNCCYFKCLLSAVAQLDSCIIHQQNCWKIRQNVPNMYYLN